MNFVDNALNPRTGTIRARAVFDNKDGLLAPGYFGRLRLFGGERSALLVPDSAISSDQSRRIIFAVAEDGTVGVKVVELGPMVDGLRVIVLSRIDGSYHHRWAAAGASRAESQTGGRQDRGLYANDCGSISAGSDPVAVGDLDAVFTLLYRSADFCRGDLGRDNPARRHLLSRPAGHRIPGDCDADGGRERRPSRGRPRR